MAYNRGVMIVVVMGMALFSSLIFSAVAQPSAHLDIDYGETKFLVTQLEDDFCGAVPNPSSMKLLSVSDWNKLVGHDCDQNKFAGYVLLSVVASFVFVALALFFGFCVFPCACLMRYRFGFFGGGRRTPVNGLKGTILPNNELDPHPGYSSYSIVATKASLGLLFLVVLAGGGIVIAGATMISHFIWQAQAIFESYPAYHLATTYSLVQTLPTLPYTDDLAAQTIALANYGLAKGLQKTGEDEITDRLSLLNNVVQAAFYLMVAVAFLLVLLGIYAAVFKLGRFSLILSLVLVLLFAAVWAEFSFVYGANNIIDKMCVAIDHCHFCVTGQWPSDNNGSNYHCSQYCKTPWFDAMKFCQPETSARYSTLETLIEGGISSAVNATCLQIQDICTSPEYSNQITQCVYPNGPCNSTDLIGVGLAGIVTVQLKSGSFESINAIANNQAVNESLRAAANEAITQAGYVTQYGGLLQQAQSLDCNSQFAFIEDIPDGTYDRLQKHLCPASPDDDIYHQRSLQTILPITAGGLMLIGVALPFIQVLLCLGEKRFAKRAKTQFGGLEDENLVEGIINNGWGMK